MVASEHCYSGCPKDMFLKPARKLSLVVTFVPSESARPDQIANNNNNNNAGLSTSTRPGEGRSFALKSSHKLYTRTRQHISHAA